MRLVEDIDLHLRLVLAGARLLRVPSAEPVFWYRLRDESVSNQNPRGLVDACVRNVAMLERRWKLQDELSEGRRQALADAYYWAARFFAEHDRTKFDDVVRSILDLRPRFVPAAPPSLHVLSRMLGYAKAERLAVLYRRVKRRAVLPA
jgi:hypothetical protein